MIKLILALTTFLVACGPTFAIDATIETKTTEQEVTRCDSDCCDSDCPPLRYKCRAYISMVDKQCGLTSDDTAIAFCRSVADFWFIPFDVTLCTIFPDPDNENLLCAEYKDELTTILANTKKGVFTKAYEAVETFIYNGRDEANVCLKFDPFCFAY